jgi:hypothetical protein
MPSTATHTAPQTVRVTPPVPRLTHCNHKGRDNRFCNRVAQSGNAYCWKHTHGWANKLVSLAKTCVRT